MPCIHARYEFARSSSAHKLLLLSVGQHITIVKVNGSAASGIEINTDETSSLRLSALPTFTVVSLHLVRR